MDDRKKTALVMDLHVLMTEQAVQWTGYGDLNLGGIIQLIIDHNTHINIHPSLSFYFPSYMIFTVLHRAT